MYALCLLLKVNSSWIMPTPINLQVVNISCTVQYRLVLFQITYYVITRYVGMPSLIIDCEKMERACFLLLFLFFILFFFQIN
jgi:hypothetical protein